MEGASASTTDLDLFTTVVRPSLEASVLYKAWAESNSTELAAYEAYRDAVLAGKPPATPPALTTPVGKTLVGVLQMVANDVAPPPPPPPAPEVKLTSSIANGTRLEAPAKWVVSAAPVQGVGRVDFLVDGTKRWQENDPPYQFDGDPEGLLDPATLGDGAHTLLAVAYDPKSQELARVLSSVTVGPPIPPPQPSIRKGVANSAGILSISSADRDFELAKCREAGAQVCRFDYGGPVHDAAFQAVVDHGMKPLINVGGTVHAANASVSRFVELCKVAANRWKGVAVAYELMNEPDLNGFTAATYAPYLKEGYAAIKAIDPHAPVLNGGLFTGGGGMQVWVQGLYDAGCKDVMDMVCLHLYGNPQQRGAWNTWDQAFYLSPCVRSVMDAHGDQDKLIVSTESGAHASVTGETEQANVVRNAFADFRARPKTGFILVYTMMNDAKHLAGWGLLDDARQPRPAYYELQKA